MGMQTRQKAIFNAAAPHKPSIETLTIGTVVGTNDPQQMGRVKVVCPHWGDSFSQLVEALPWATYVSPFGGQTSVGSRGPGDDESTGGISYGMWAIPKVGAQVIVMCIDGDPNLRVYLGCIFNQLATHTMPHGRFMYDDSPALPTTGEPHPFGPFTSREQPIEPLNANLHQSFNKTSDPNYEFRTRGADYSAAGLRVESLAYTASNVQDDINAVYDGWTSTQGYGVNRANPVSDSQYTDKNYDSTVYSITSPGFHALSMDDRQENCRFRIRTTAGHQIIMDDTNERVYIATAKGNNWIEMDQDGNIDMFTTGKISARAKEDISFTSDKTIRFRGKQGIHFYSDDEIRMQSLKDINMLATDTIVIQSTTKSLDLNVATSIKLTAGSTVDVNAGSTLNLTSATAMGVKSGAALSVQSTGALGINSGAALNLQSSADTNIQAGSALKMKSSAAASIKSGADLNLEASAAACLMSGSAMNLAAPSVSIGGSVALVANVPGTHAANVTINTTAPTAALAATATTAYWPIKVPDHEPYARCTTLNDFTDVPEFSYTDPQVGKSERFGKLSDGGRRTVVRGKYWRR